MAPSPPCPIVHVLNWDSEIHEKVPVRKVSKRNTQILDEINQSKEKLNEKLKMLTAHIDTLIT